MLIVNVGVLQYEDLHFGIVILVCQCSFDNIQREIAYGTEIREASRTKGSVVVDRHGKGEILLFCLTLNRTCQGCWCCLAEDLCEVLED